MTTREKALKALNNITLNRTRERLADVIAYLDQPPEHSDAEVWEELRQLQAGFNRSSHGFNVFYGVGDGEWGIINLAIRDGETVLKAIFSPVQLRDRFREMVKPPAPTIEDEQAKRKGENVMDHQEFLMELATLHHDDGFPRDANKIRQSADEIERLQNELETERGHREADNKESRDEIERLTQIERSTDTALKDLLKAFIPDVNVSGGGPMDRITVISAQRRKLVEKIEQLRQALTNAVPCMPLKAILEAAEAAEEK